MSLKLYNSLTGREETFEPLEPGKVRMYCCGVTVYDYCHLGHARSYIVWDTVRRYLISRGYQVRYVQNFTDIDDKILNRAREQNSSMEEVSERFIKEYFVDMDRLNIMRADEYPRATHTLNGITRLIHELEQKGYAYPASGDVYYTVRKFADYGKLSGRKFEEMDAGASGRVTDDSEEQKKQDPFDFALWKGAKEGEPFWESPWGNGRPGWHIECSAMVRQCLGETIDIHCGGADLIFPHHENEIAQSEAVTGQSLAKYWMHNGFVTVNAEKMSKSLGNFTTIRELLERLEPMALRLFVLMAQYRKPIDFTDDAIAGARNGWTTLKDGLSFGYQYGNKWGWKLELIDDISPLDSDAIQQFTDAMDNDFNTAIALGVLFELAKELRREKNIVEHGGKIETPGEVLNQKWLTLLKLASVLGLEFAPEVETEETSKDGLSDAQIEELIAQRKAARNAKNFAESDRVRDLLKSQGITLIDQKDGTTIWRKN